MALPQGPNHRWSLNFGADQLGGRRFRALVIVDAPGSAWPWWATARNLASVLPELEVVVTTRGRPMMILSETNVPTSILQVPCAASDAALQHSVLCVAHSKPN